MDAGYHEIVNLLLHQVGIQLSLHHLIVSIALIKTAKALFEGIDNTTSRTRIFNLYVEDSCRRKALICSAEVELGVVLNLSLKPNRVWINRGGNNASDILLYATWSGLKDAVAFLLRIKNIKWNFRDGVGRTALMLASESGRQAVVAMLLEESDVETNCTDQYARTALMLADEKAHEGILAMLLGKDVIDINLRDMYDRNALMLLAAASGYPGAVARLLGSSDVQTNCKDMVARTALMLAAKLGHADVVTKLLAKDDVLRDCKDVEGRTALSLAARGEHRNVLGLLFMERLASKRAKRRRLG